jgi:hypothetical protein
VGACSSTSSAAPGFAARRPNGSRHDERINETSRQHLDGLLGPLRPADWRSAARSKGGFGTQRAAQTHLASVITATAAGGYVEPWGASFGPPKSKRYERTIAPDPDKVDCLRNHRETQRLERDLAGTA